MNPRCLAFAMVLAGSGCSSFYPAKDSEPSQAEFLVSIERGETIALALKSSTGLDGPQPVTEEAEKAIKACIKEGLLKAKSPLVLSESQHPQLRYRIDLVIKTWVENYRAWGDASLIGWISTRSRDKRTLFSADVVDLKTTQVVGHVEAEATRSTESGVMGLFFIIPIPLAGSAPTETAACRHFGELLARRFLPR